jgi:hypothetical protein
MHNRRKDTRLPDAAEAPIFVAMPLRSETLDRDTATQTCTCAWKGCGNAGEFRAPRDQALRSYFMFCLEHVRAYNASWDYHKGCTSAEMEAEIRSAATWERPTWKLGALGGGRRRFKVEDPFGFAAGTAFDPEGESAQSTRHKAESGRAPRDEAVHIHAARISALKALDLTMPVTLDGLKRRYKALVKRHHPDANGGSAEAETRMKIINQAYQTLRAELSASPAP